MTGRAAAVAALIALAAGSVALQAERDRRYAPATEEARLLYLRSGETAKRLTLEYQALAADIYWIRALVHYGGDRLGDDQPRRYDLLYPLLDLTTSLDPLFRIAYRFGAVFLAEPPPGGPGRLDLAEKLLLKGMAASPERWEYPYDLAFLYYWQEQDYVTAAKWFQHAAALPGSPEWLGPIAAGMLARGGDRASSRQLLLRILDGAEQEWMRQTATRWLRQLDALDQMDQLDALLADYHRRTGTRPESWHELVGAGWLRGIPLDPSGHPYLLNPTWSTTRLSPGSPLNPLPAELAR